MIPRHDLVGVCLVVKMLLNNRPESFIGRHQLDPIPTFCQRLREAGGDGSREKSGYGPSHLPWTLGSDSHGSSRYLSQGRGEQRIRMEVLINLVKPQ